MNIHSSIKKLACYALEKQLITEEEYSYSINLLLDALDLDEFEDDGKDYKNVSLEETLDEILDYAFEKKIIQENSVVYRDLLTAKIRNCFTPRPDEVIRKFKELEKVGSEKATDYFYNLSIDSDYVMSYRIKKDLHWKTASPYGDLDITINLSKPEKDPKAIAAAKLRKQTSYPKCFLCKENMGYRGTLTHPARETIRYIPLRLSGGDYYLQYSPYSYYPEHCIVFNKEHIPRVVNRKTFEHLVDFVDEFPHYRLGSNADLPIVGGSILTHDHYQGGRYIFPMFLAKDVFSFTFKGYENIKASYLYWPLSVIRLKAENKEELINLSDKILNCWRKYTDEKSFVLAETENTPHNTITPILHKEGKEFIRDLTLRNNITTEQYPLGVYHPHQEYWNIKKENIGLIEVMGRAILPSRLKEERKIVAERVKNGKDLNENPSVAKHASWLNQFQDRFNGKQSLKEIDSILEEEIGHTFQHVLECAGVYKQNEEGYEGIKRFIQFVNKD